MWGGSSRSFRRSRLDSPTHPPIEMDMLGGMFGGEEANDSPCEAEAPGQAMMATGLITIKEKVNMLEAFTAMAGQEVEMANRYGVENEEGQRIFFAIEQTNCCMRQMKQVFPDCAPWDIDINYTGHGGSTLAYKMTRPWTCTFCCFNRPEVELVDVLNGDELVGTLTDPWTCCDLTYTGRDKDGDDIFYVKGGCCQMGLFCPLPCGPCSEVHFSVENADGLEVSELTKKVPGCCKFLMAPDVDNYVIDFTGGLDQLNQRLLMMAMAIFVDYRYFNDNPNDDNDGGGGE